MYNLSLRPATRPSSASPDVYELVATPALQPQSSSSVGSVITNFNVLDMSIDKLTTGSLTATGTITSLGKFQTAESPNPRIEITNTLIAGYSDATTKQFYLQATDGKAYAGGGKVILDSAGVSINNTGTDTNLLQFQYDGVLKSRIYADTALNGLYIDVSPTGTAQRYLWQKATLDTNVAQTTMDASTSSATVTLNAAQLRNGSDDYAVTNLLTATTLLAQWDVHLTKNAPGGSQSYFGMELQTGSDTVYLKGPSFTVYDSSSAGSVTASITAATGDVYTAGNVQMKGPRPWVDARAYGATGDGTTDDTTNLATAATAATGGTLFVPKGTYLLSTTLTIPASTTLRGAGMYETVFKHGAAQTVGCIFAGGTNVQLMDFAIDGNQANNTSFASTEMSYGGYADVVAQRVRIYNHNRIGINCAAARAVVRECHIVGVGNTTSSEVAYGIWFDNTDAVGVRILDNTIKDTRVGAIFGGGTGAIIANNYITGCHTQTSPTGGGQIAWGTSAKNHTVIGNTIDTGGGTVTSGVEINNIIGVTVTGNNITAQGLYGVVAQAGDICAVVSGNVIKNCNDSAIYIAANVDGFTITSNRCYDDRGGSASQDYGIEVVAGTSDHYIIMSNDCRGNVSGGVSDGGTGADKYVSDNLV